MVKDILSFVSLADSSARHQKSKTELTEQQAEEGSYSPSGGCTRRFRRVEVSLADAGPAAVEDALTEKAKMGAAVHGGWRRQSRRVVDVMEGCRERAQM
ncbi:hypothetical protein SESBI_27655 [Sesbania bispinosa]|nr:hypothetical protein SESBI_27655 [Sesbania bispinosa]